MLTPCKNFFENSDMLDKNSEIPINYDLILAVLVVILTVAYLIDAVAASTQIVNLIFIVPVAFGIFVISGYLIFAEISHAENTQLVNEEAVDYWPIYRAMALFVGYVLSLNWLGFDVGTALFIGVFLWAQGVRRIAPVLAFSFSLGFGLAAFFQFMLPYPMPMLVL